MRTDRALENRAADTLTANTVHPRTAFRRANIERLFQPHAVVILPDHLHTVMTQAGETVPEAMSDRRYSGSFLTRVPEQLHRTLAIEAAEAGISLNRLVSYKPSIPIPIPGRSAKATTKPHKAA